MCRLSEVKLHMRYSMMSKRFCLCFFFFIVPNPQQLHIEQPHIQNPLFSEEFVVAISGPQNVAFKLIPGILPTNLKP